MERIPDISSALPVVRGVKEIRRDERCSSAGKNCGAPMMEDEVTTYRADFCWIVMICDRSLEIVIAGTTDNRSSGFSNITTGEESQSFALFSNCSQIDLSHVSREIESSVI